MLHTQEGDLMGNILFWALCIATFSCFLLCAVYLAFNKDFNMSENLSSGMTLLASLIILVLTCTLIPDGDTSLFQNSNGLVEGINNAAGEVIPFYKYLANSKDGIGLLEYYKNNYLEFAQELLQTIFMASVIPAINKLLPSVIIAEKKHNKIIMLLSVNFITVAITMVLYSFFQKTTIASTILDIIVAVCSMTPLAFLVKKVLFGTTKDWIVLTALATFFGKAILESIAYMVFIHEVAIQKAELIASVNVFMYVLPSLMVCGIMIIGIGMCIKSIIS